MYDKYLQEFIDKNKITIEHEDQIKSVITIEDRWKYVKDFFNSTYGSKYDILADDKIRRIKVFFDDSKDADTFENTCEDGLLKYIRSKVRDLGKDPKDYNFNFTSIISHAPNTKVVDYTVV